MSLVLQIAGIIFNITSEPGIQLTLAGRHQHFRSGLGFQPPTKESLQIHYCQSIHEPKTGPVRIYVGGLKPYHWKVFKYPGQAVVYLFYPNQPTPTLISLNPRNIEQTILIQDPSEQTEALRYPTDLIVLQMLGHFFKIILIHACGFSMSNSGILGLGSSGAGKTTLTRLAKECGALIIQDDRLFLREQNDGWWMYPVPLGISDQHLREQIHQIILLNHGADNRLHPIHQDRKTDRFLPHIAHFPIFPESYFYQLFLSDELIRNKPIYDLYFQPNTSSIRFLASQLLFQGTHQEFTKARPLG